MSLWAGAKAEGQNWMCVIFRPSGSTALKTDMILYWTSLMDSGTLPEITVHEHSLLCNPQMPITAVLREEEATCEHDPETLLSSLDQSSSKIHHLTTVVRCIKIQMFIFGNHCVLQTKEERNHPASYQQTVQKSASLMVWSCISVYGVDSWNIWKGSISDEENMEVSEQHTLPSRWRLFQGRPCIFQQDSAKPHTASIRNRKHLVHHEIKDLARFRTVELLESCIRQEYVYIPLLKL